MSNTVTSQKQIPDAPFYVLSNDKFMSGWGEAKGMINTCIVPCKDEDELKRVMGYVESRNDQNRIRYCTNKPQIRRHTLYSLLTAWIETSKGGKRQ